MNKINRSGRLRRRLALAVALIVSGSAQPLSPVEVSAFAALISGQQQSASSSKVRASQYNRQSVDKSLARSREAEPQTEVVYYSSPDGPIIRVALMIDATSVALSCSSGLIVNRATASFDEGKRISSGSLRVELRQPSDPVAPREPGVAAVYRVIVGFSHESRVARNLVDELKKKFFEPVTMTFDENQNEYSVLIGQCPTRNEAAQLVDRLRKAGYQGLRIVSDPRTGEPLAPESATGSNTRTAIYKGQSNAAGRPIIERDRPTTQLVAIAADKITASSEDELIIAPAESTWTGNRIKQSAVSVGDDEKGKRIKQEQRELSAYPEAAPPPVTVRVGNKDYRGEIHLVLNARGLINVVNALPLEEYLRGVVLMEIPMGSTREIEALKAQAVAARSYALSHIGQRHNQGYDLLNDARAQAYGGLASERELTNRAIDETRGVVAVYPNEGGKPVPIEALYTANCGGRTENNEEVFGGKPRPYLRSVVCALDRPPLAGRDIATRRTLEPLNGIDGRLIAREVATLSVLGFSLPRRVTSNYLQGSPDRDEIRNWMEQTAQLAQREKPDFTGDIARRADFARLIAASIYGEGRASTLLDAADVDYLLAGTRVEQLPREARADVAMLLRDGILRLNAGAALDGRGTISRGEAIETLARALLLRSTADVRSQNSDLRSQISNRKSQISDFKSQIADFKFGTSAPSERGRLMLAAPSSPGNVASRAQTPRFTGVNTNGPGSIARPQPDGSRESRSPRIAKDIAAATNPEQGASQRNLLPDGLEVAETAWLFRNVGGESYAVDRLTLIGGERITYHLNAGGQVDYLEASLSAQSASSDRLSAGRWQERIPVEELQQRLARARVNVGQLQTVDPVAFSTSGRVSELEIAGDEGRARLRGRQIISAIGLKETLFVVAAEKDSRGRVIAFVFTGRGWGHGVGMCQAGAYALAKDGYSYTAILQKYYFGVKVQEMY